MRRFLFVVVFACCLGVAQGQTHAVQTEKQMLLAPKALASEPGPMRAAELKRLFANPPASYRSMPLWVWNDEMDPARIKEQLVQFKQQGMGGVFVHPRPGLMTEYLGSEWFRLWKVALEEGKRLGIEVNIYDENSYPSGFAGGHVPAKAPDTAAQYVQADFDVTPASVARRGTPVSHFAVQQDASGAVIAIKRITSPDQIPSGWKPLTFRLRRASGNPWTGEFPYVDLTNPRTAPAFLETTYEKYKQSFGVDFGKSLRWAFTDEPLISAGGAYDSAKFALPLSFNTLAEFRKRNGYDLADHMPSLYWDVGDFRKVRFDYWQTMHDLWKENWAVPMFAWNDANNLRFTGHYMEHEWPAPWITPADASMMAWEHAPGIDMLEGTKIRTTGSDPHMLFTIKEVASVAHQLGRRAFCEAYGVAGWDSTLEHYKRFGDWLMVHGVNFMNQHLAFTTVRGARKRDHPQSFSDISAWWPYYKLHGDHLGRVSMLSARSTSANRLVILQQTTSGFLLARRGGAIPEIEAMRARNAEMNQFLADRQVDFDLGDEYMVEWIASAAKGKFVIGKRSYDLVAIPPDMINMRHQTVAVLDQYLQQGGEVIALSDAAQYVDGAASDAVARLASKYSKQWHRVASLNVFAGEIRSRLQPRVVIDKPVLANVGLLERYLPDGDRVLFFANTGLATATANASVEAASIEVLDTVSGEIHQAAYTSAAGRVTFPIELAPAGSLAILVHKTVAAAPKPAQDFRFARLDAGAWTAKPLAKNVLPLDYTTVVAGPETWANVNTWQANWNIWQRQGFERPAWDNAVQFKHRNYEKKFAADSGFESTFRFNVADAAAIDGMELAIETPEQYRVSVNGKPVEFGAAARWLDPHLKSLAIGKLVTVGENTVTLKAKPFNIRMELENIYLRGNFKVESAAAGFTIKAGHALEFGSWAKQGYTFYSDSVAYSAPLDIPVGMDMLRVDLGRWNGSVAAVSIDGKKAAVIGWQPWRAEVPVKPGKHTVTITVVSTPRNTMGPFHNPTKPRMRAWPAAWAEFPDQQPAGDAYDVIDYGLMEAPALSVAKTAPTT